MMNSITRAAVVAVSLFAAASPAFAHVTLEVKEAKLGSTYKAIIRIPHGCGTEATNVVRVQIPEGFYNVKPMPHAGWKLETVQGPYEGSYDNHGTTLTEGVKEIVWSGGDLPNEFYDEFVFRGTFAKTLDVGTFYFPTIQECVNGEEAWIEIMGGENVEMPAPSLELLPADSTSH